MLLGLSLAVLPARAQETAGAEPPDLEAMVEAGQAVLLPLGDAFKAPEPAVETVVEETPPDDGEADQTASDDGDIADATTSDEQVVEDSAAEVAPGEPEVEVALEETTEELEPEAVSEPDVVTEIVSDQEVIDETIEEIAETEVIETPEPDFLIEDEVEEQDVGEVDPSPDLESEIEAAVIDEEGIGEGSADTGGIEEQITETVIAEETVIDEVIVDPETGELAAEAIVIEETVVEEVTIDEPVVAEPAAEEVAAEETAVEFVETEEPVTEQPVEHVEPETEEIVVAETVVETPDVEPAAGDQPDTLVGAMVPLRTAELGNAESIGPYRLWLASYKTVRQAKEGWQQIALANQDLLADLTPIIVLKDLGQDEGTFFRLQAGPLQSQTSASARCTALVDRNVYCSVLGP